MNAASIGPGIDSPIIWKHVIIAYGIAIAVALLIGLAIHLAVVKGLRPKHVARWVLKDIGGFGTFFMFVAMPIFLGYWISAEPVFMRWVSSGFLYLGMWAFCGAQHRKDERRIICKTARAEARELVKDLLVGARSPTGDGGEVRVSATELECIERGLEEPPT